MTHACALMVVKGVAEIKCEAARACTNMKMEGGEVYCTAKDGCVDLDQSSTPDCVFCSFEAYDLSGFLGSPASGYAPAGPYGPKCASAAPSQSPSKSSKAPSASPCRSPSEEPSLRPTTAPPTPMPTEKPADGVVACCYKPSVTLPPSS